MYQSWQWPAVAATSITDTTALAAGNTTTVTSVPATTWPVQAFNQYAMANMQQQQWAWSQAQGSYPYATGMATQAAYVTPDAYPATTVQSAVPTTEAPKTGQSAPTTTTTTAAAQEEKKPAKSKEEDLTVKDPTELEKLNQLRAQAQQWTSQQTASWPYSTAATASVASSNVALATPWPQGAWNPAAWPQGQWNQQWPQQNWTQQSQSQQADLSVTVATATPSDSEKTDSADPPKEIEGLEDLDKEEQEFDKQFKDCEQQFEEWKKQNMNHPDKDAFARYEKQWQSWRDEQLQKKEEMQKERAKRIAAAKSAAAATTAAEIVQNAAQKPSSLNSPASATGLNQQNPNPKQDLGSANQAAVEDTNRSNFSQGQLATQPYPYPQQFMGPSGIPVMPPSCLPGMFPPTMLRGPPPGMPMIPPTGLLGPPPVIPGAPRPGLAGAPHPGGAPPGLLAAPPPNIPASAPSGGSGAPPMTPQQNSSQPQNQFDHQPGPYDNQRQPPFENQRQPPFESRQPPFENQRQPPFENQRQPPFENQRQPPFENQRQPPFENQQRQNQYDNQQQKQQSFQRQPPFPNQQRPHPNQQMPGNMEGPMSEFNPSGMRNRGPGGMQRNEFQCKEGLLGNEPAGDFMPSGKMRGDAFGNSDPYIEHEGEWPGRMHQDMPFSRGRGRGRPGRGRGQPGGPRWEMGGGGREDMPNRRFDRFGDDPKCGGAESSEFDPDTGMISTKFPPDQPNEDEFSDQPFLDGCGGGGRFPPGDFQGGQGPPFENNPSGPCPPFKNERRPLLSFEGECGLPFGNKNECGPPFGNKNECGPPFGNKNECGPPFGNKNECGPPFGNKNECGPPFGNKNECGPPFGNKNECGPPFGNKNECGPPFGNKNERGPPFGNKNERGPPFGNKNERGPLIPFEGEQGMPPPFANEIMQPPFNRERGPHPFDEQGPHPFDNERGLLPFDNDQRPGFDAEQGPHPFDRDQGPRPFNDERGPRLPFDDDRGPWPPFNNDQRPWLNNERRPFDNEQFPSDMGRMNQDRFGPDERERFFRGNRFGPSRFDDDFPQQGMFPEDRFPFEEGPPHMMSDEFSNRRFPPQMRRFPQDLMRNDMEGPFDFPPEERFGCDFPDGEGPRFPPRFRGDHFRDQPQLPPPGFRGEVIDYIHRPAASVVGNDFSMMYDAFDQEFSTNLLNYRDSAYMGEIPPPPSPIIFSQVDVEAFDYSHGSKPVVTSTVKAKNSEKDVKTPFSNKAIFDYAHRRERNRSPFRDRHLKDHDNNRLERPPRDSFRERDRERCRDRDRNRDRDRDSDRDKERDSDRDRDRRDRNDRGDRDRERFRDKDRDLKRGRDWDRCRDSSKDKDDSDRNKRSRWDREKSPEKKRESESSRKHNGERNRDETPVSSDSNAIALPQDESLKKEVTEIASLKDLLFPPTRFTRPKQLVIILRGLPGSGKTYVAKLIKDKELEHGGCAPRILSLDDYFMVETEVTETDPETGKKVKKKEFQFEYEDCMEEAYRASLFKSFKKTVDDRFFPFIIVDAVHEESKQYEQLWSYAKQRGFQVYIAEMDCKDPVICHKRNVHKRSIGEINKILKKWESKPRHFMSVDIRPLLQDVAITEVEMEDSVVSSEFVDKKEEPTKKQEKEDDDDEKEESSMFSHVPSRWEKLETTEEKLDQLDGLRTSKKKHSTMEDYLQLPDDYEERKCEPGKKRVRWADLEERKEQDRLRAIGFVVGQTDWSKMTDPSHADRALTRTKYF